MSKPPRGISLLETLFSLALLTVIIAGIVGSVRHLGFLSDLARQRTTAIANLNTMLECLRATPVASVQATFPAGAPLPSATLQNTCGLTTTLSNESITVVYLGAPNPLDQVQVIIQWSIGGGLQTVSGTTRRVMDGA